jgi:hypothetical protein
LTSLRNSRRSSRTIIAPAVRSILRPQNYGSLVFPGVGTAIGGGGGIFGGLGGGELASRGFDWPRSWFVITGLPHACLVESLAGSRRA